MAGGFPELEKALTPCLVLAYSSAASGDLDGSYISAFLPAAALPTAATAVFMRGSRFS
jgi:hypothetical protein